ncbi:MAG: hypothetical protein E4H36_04235 [Spirochaetales bacterium]|nr:MAG: hypothetical protein E4H36_04235 [Spirochaetales bacterium]
MRIVADSSYVISNCRVLSAGVERDVLSIVVRDRRIEAVDEGSAGFRPPSGIPVYDAKGLYVMPGFVELHIHGCGMDGVEQAPDEPGVLARMADFLSSRGCNTFLPTLPFNLPVIEALAAELTENPQLEERVPGIYVEGPFVNPARRGGIPPAFVEVPDKGRLNHILETGRERIRMMTVAPELPGADVIISRLWERGIIPCLGHSESDLRGIPEAPPGKALNITHLFNAMSPVSHKTAGLAMLPFIDRSVYCELNSDGIHVCGEALTMCGRHIDNKRLILISDAVVSAGLAGGSGSYFGKEVLSDKRGVRYADSDILIGSNRLVHECAGCFLNWTGLGRAEVAGMVTSNPNRLLDRGDRGLVSTGMKADLIAVDGDFRPVINFFPY